MACYLLEIPVVQLTGIRSLGVELFENWCGMIKLPGIKLKCKLESKRWLNECECQLKIFIPDFVLTKSMGSRLPLHTLIPIPYAD